MKSRGIPTPVLILETGGSGGGSFESLYQFLRGIDRSRYRPVVAYANPTKYVEWVRNLDIPVHLIRDWNFTRSSQGRHHLLVRGLLARSARWAPRIYVQALRWLHRPALEQLGSVVRDHQVELLHLNNTIRRDLFALHLALRHQLPSISHLRSVRTSVLHPEWARFANQHVDRFIAVSDAGRSHWKELGLDPDKIVRIFNGASNDPVTPCTDSFPLHWQDEDRFIIGCASPMHPDKGHHTLLQAFAELAPRCPNARLLLVGDGEEYDKLQSEAAELGLDRRVHMPGYKNDARAIIAACDVAVVPSEVDAFPRTILEAMQAERPVVATTVGGIPEMVAVGETGFLVPPGASNALAARLDELYRNRARARAMGLAGRQRLQAHFSLEQHCRGVENIYRLALQRHGQREQH